LSVIETVWLPDQPSSGITDVQPLGGNGWSAPHSAVYSEALSSGDASGGTNRIQFRFDESHTALPYWLSLKLTGQSADSRALVNLVFGEPGGGMNVQDSVLLHHTPEGGASESYATWRIPPVVCNPRPGAGSGNATVPFIEVYVENAVGANLTAHLYALEFNPNVAQVTPFPYLTANFPS